MGVRSTFRGCLAGVSRLTLGALSGTHGAERTGREPQGGGPGGPPSPPRRPGPGREQGGRGAASDGTPGPGLGCGAGGLPAGGTRRKPTPSPPSLIWFSHPQRPSRTKGAREGPVEEPAPCSQRPRPRARGGRGRRGWGGGGRADTPGAPLQQRPTPPSSQRGCREAQTRGTWTRTPRRPKDSHPARERRPLGSANAPCAGGDPSLRPGTEDPLTGGRARGTGRGASLPQGWAHGAQGSARVGKTQIGQGVRGWHPGRGLSAA